MRNALRTENDRLSEMDAKVEAVRKRNRLRADPVEPSRGIDWKWRGKPMGGLKPHGLELKLKGEF